MSVFELLLTGNSRDLAMCVLGALALIVHSVVCGYVRHRTRTESSTLEEFKRSSTTLLLCTVTVLGVSVLFPQIASSAAFKLTCPLLLVPIAMHGLVRISQTGIQNTPGYIASFASLFVAVLLLPALYLSEVADVVRYTVSSIVMCVPVVVATVALAGLVRQAAAPRGTLKAFRARRTLQVLGLSVLIGIFATICTPFFVYAVPVESVSIIWCSSLVCATGMHVATERVGFLVEYVRSELPALGELDEQQLEHVTRYSLKAAQRLIENPHVSTVLGGNENFPPGLLHASGEIVRSDADSTSAIVQRIESHRSIEDEFFDRLINLQYEAAPYIDYTEFSRLIEPHIALSKALLGEEVAGLSEELMGTINEIRIAAESGEPVFIVGELGVGKSTFARVVGRLRGIPVEHMYRIELPSTGRSEELEEVIVSLRAVKQRALCILSITQIDDELAVEQIVRAVRSKPAYIEIVIVSENATLVDTVAKRCSDSRFTPPIIKLNPLRERIQDVPCQVVWHAFKGAEEMYGLETAQAMKIPVECLLESMTYAWRGNTAELKERVKVALLRGPFEHGVGPRSIVQTPIDELRVS